MKGLESALEESVLEDLSEKLTLIKDFKVTSMDQLPVEVRSQLVQFISMVIEQHKSQMTKMDFTELISN